MGKKIEKASLDSKVALDAAESIVQNYIPESEKRNILQDIAATRNMTNKYEDGAWLKLLKDPYAMKTIEEYTDALGRPEELLEGIFNYERNWSAKLALADLRAEMAQLYIKNGTTTNAYDTVSSISGAITIYSEIEESEADKGIKLEAIIRKTTLRLYALLSNVQYGSETYVKKEQLRNDIENYTERLPSLKQDQSWKNLYSLMENMDI